jgi:hypothetical protein
MNFDLSDEQRALAEAAGAFFADTTSPAASREALESGTPIAPGRAALAQTGFAAITVPESAGGGGGSLLDLAVVAEQAGRVLAGPSLVTAARAAVLLAGDDKRLAALADGSTAYAVIDGDSPVLDGATAEVFLARAGDALVGGAGRVTTREPIDPTRGLADVSLEEPPATAGRRPRTVGPRRAGRAGHPRRRGSRHRPPRPRDRGRVRLRTAARSAARSAPTRRSSTRWSRPTSASRTCARWSGGPRGRPTSRRTSCRSRPRP